MTQSVYGDITFKTFNGDSNGKPAECRMKYTMSQNIQWRLQW